MKTYNTTEELKADLNGDRDLIVVDDVTITFELPAGIVRNIDCQNICCWNIKCQNIKCQNIDCWNIDCWNIDCWNIDYYASVICHNSCTCHSFKARRKKALPIQCLDGVLTVDGKEQDAIS